MKTFTFRKKWNTFIAELPQEKRNQAVLYVYNLIMTGEKPETDDSLYTSLICMVEKDLEKSAQNREKARQRREAKKAAQQKVLPAVSENEQVSTNVVADESSQLSQEYAQYPELYMFDGFMYYLIATRDKDKWLTIPFDDDTVGMLKLYREWVIESRRFTRCLEDFGRYYRVKCGTFRNMLKSNR